MARFTGDAVIREARVVSSWVQSDLLYRVALDERLDYLERLARELALACRVEVLDELAHVLNVTRGTPEQHQRLRE